MSDLDGNQTFGGRRPQEYVVSRAGSGAMRSRIVTAVLTGGIALAACGGAAESPVGADGTAITVPTPTEGPTPQLAVSAEAAAASPLPEVTVRRINGEGGFVQLKNELPSDRPLLVWFWAPH